MVFARALISRREAGFRVNRVHKKVVRVLHSRARENLRPSRSARAQNFKNHSFSAVFKSATGSPAHEAYKNHPHLHISRAVFW